MRTGAAHHRFPPDRHHPVDSGLISTHRRRPPTPSAPSYPLGTTTHPRPRRPVMGTFLIAGTVVLFLLGFNNHVWWLAAGFLLFVYVSHGRNSSSASSTGSGGPPGAAGNYQQYRER